MKESRKPPHPCIWIWAFCEIGVAVLDLLKIWQPVVLLALTIGATVSIIVKLFIEPQQGDFFCVSIAGAGTCVVANDGPFMWALLALLVASLPLIALNWIHLSNPAGYTKGYRAAIVLMALSVITVVLDLLWHGFPPNPWVG